MERLVFRSLHNPAIAYTVHNSSTDLWDSHYRNRHGALASWAGQFDVYNDFPVQHSHEICAPKSAFCDYCVSLADAATKDESMRRELGAKFYVVGRLLINERAERRLVFFQGLRYKESKVQYYNAADCKVSAAPAKRHDKRWHEVPSWADGSVEACHRFMVGEGADFLESFALYSWIRDRVALLTDHYAEHPAEYFKLDQATRSHVHGAFAALISTITSAQELENAARQVKCYRHNAQMETANESAA